MARSIWAGVRGGSTAIVGTSHGIAPYVRSRSLIAPACSLVRGTSTFHPYSGRFSHQPSLSRWVTAGPRLSTTRPVIGVAADQVYGVQPGPGRRQQHLGDIARRPLGRRELRLRLGLGADRVEQRLW